VGFKRPLVIINIVMSSVKIELRQDQIDKILAIYDSFGNLERELINVMQKPGNIRNFPAEYLPLAKKMSIFEADVRLEN